MEKVLLRRKTVLEDGIIKNKFKITNKIIATNPNLTLEKGWTDGDPTEPSGCPPPTEAYYYVKVAGECVKVPY